MTFRKPVSNVRVRSILTCSFTFIVEKKFKACISKRQEEELRNKDMKIVEIQYFCSGDPTGQTLPSLIEYSQNIKSKRLSNHPA